MKKRVSTSAPKPMLERLFVGLFIGGFFALLPLWALSNREGWIRFHCAGSPWQCTISHTKLLSRSAETFTPGAIEFSSESHVGYKGYTYRSWQLTFITDGQRLHVLSGDDAGEAMKPLALEFEAARAAGTPFDRELPPDWGFWFLAAVAALFFCAGMFIALSA